MVDVVVVGVVVGHHRRLPWGLPSSAILEGLEVLHVCRVRLDKRSWRCALRKRSGNDWPCRSCSGLWGETSLSSKERKGLAGIWALLLYSRWMEGGRLDEENSTYKHSTQPTGYGISFRVGRYLGPKSIFLQAPTKSLELPPSNLLFPIRTFLD